MNYSDLINSIEQAFIHQDSYFFDKHVPELTKDGSFLADFYSLLAIEPRGKEAPRFYHTFSPFDVISKKAPDQAVVFEAGEILLNTDFTSYVPMRTAAMNAVVLKSLGIRNLADKKVLLFGAGSVAAQAVKVLSSELGLKSVDIISKSGDLSNLTETTKNLGITISPGNLQNIGQYDVIAAHTNTDAALIPTESISQIKRGAVLTSFISSTEHGEFPDQIFDAAQANIITDWPQSLAGAKDLKRALDSHLFNKQDLIYIKDLLTGTQINPDKRYTIYRSTGTPIQNLAVLKLLV